ncbi:MAG: hypothetical protein AABZ47_01125 [Planctomycetota bacterium]
MRSFGWRTFCGGCAAVLSLLMLSTVAFAGKLTDGWKDTLKAMDEAKLTPAKAVEAAEAHSKGKAVSIMGMLKDKKLTVTVNVIAEGKCKAVTVDSAGKATGMADAKADDMSCGTGADAVKMMDAAKTTLGKAIAAAEEHSKGKAVAAMSAADSVTVACAVGDKMMMVTVDKTGKATKMDEEKEKTPIKGG